MRVSPIVYFSPVLFPKATPSYDLYSSDGKKIGWIEKKLVSLGDSFDVYMEGQGGFGVTGLFKPTPAYRIEGDFLDRNFSFKNEEGKIVARSNMDGESCEISVECIRSDFVNSSFLPCGLRSIMEVGCSWI